MRYYAHSNQQDQTHWQTVKEHLTNTAEIAQSIGKDTGLTRHAYICALLHDIGKYSPAFQQRLLGAAKRVDHSTAGAKEVYRVFSKTEPQKLQGKMLAYCIAGHHGGLPDHGSVIDCDTEPTLCARLSRTVEPFEHYLEEIDPSSLVLPDRLPIQPIAMNAIGFSLSFFTRMIYSILVDADFIETETFMNGGLKPRGGYADIATLSNLLSDFLTKFENPKGSINQRRTETMKSCISRAEEPKGLFTLTLPTGAGKTYTSMGFALRHAAFHVLSRIIYVIPYTSIIEQNAAVFKQCLGEDNILEHHSNFDWNPNRKENSEWDEEGALYTKLKLAAENWDIPIVVTTNVQFFESLYSNRSSRCRKIHNIAKSMIVFDEAQMLPRDYLKPCLFAVAELVKNYGSSAIFCTATQPSIDRFLPPGISTRELIPDPQSQFDFYRRVQVINKGSLPDTQLLDEVNGHEQVLCIVNTRRHAKGLFAGLHEDGRFHLSTLMCAKHRSQVIATIREKLRNHMTCRVISTQLLEAGVDLDFPIGYRALAGLEAIIQAGGRINREGKQSMGTLYVFEPVSDHIRRVPVYIQQTGEVARNILNRFSDPICIEAVKEYYDLLYDLHDPQAFDRNHILADLERDPQQAAFDFKSVADKFKLIENDTVSVIIPYDTEAEALIRNLQITSYPMSAARMLQPYTVNIYEPEYQVLLDAGAIKYIDEDFPVLLKKELYDHETGLMIPSQQAGEGIIF